MVAALQKRNDLLVDRARDGRYDDSALVRIFAPAAFVLLPVIVDQKPAGCLYADLAGAAAGLDTMLYPLARLRDGGHLIGNHTFTHPGLVALAEAGGDVVGELARTDAVIRPFVATPFVPFRAPYGNWRQLADPDRAESWH